MPRLLHIIVCAASTTYIAMFAVIAGLRLRYPYELEWLEGWMVDSARQILDGRSLYRPPTFEFVTSVYNPMYFSVTAAFAWVMGLSFTTARLVSVLSTFGILTLLIFRLHASSRSAGLVAAGLYAASYRFAGAWMDIAKTDSLFLFTLLAAFLVGRNASTAGRDVASGVLYSLAFFTKQTALPIVAIVFTAQLLFQRQRWRQWATFAIVSAAGVVALDWSTNGWYSFYTFETPMHFITAADPWRLGGIARLSPLLLIMAFMSVLSLARQRQVTIVEADATSRREAWTTIVTVLFGVGLVVSTWAMFRHRGTYDNVFLPACFGLAICGGLAFGELWPAVSRRSESHSGRCGWHRLAFSAVALLVVLQFVVYRYNPIAQVPTRADYAAGSQFVSLLRDLPGRVLVWSHGHYAEMAGKSPSAHDMAVSDAAGTESYPPRNEDNRWRRQLVRSTWDEGIERRVFDWIVIDSASSTWFPNYVEAARLAEFPREFTGFLTHPRTLLMKNPMVDGGWLDLADRRLNFLFGDGWGQPEPSGRSLIGANATLAVALNPEFDYQVQVIFRLSCESAARTALVGVRWNETLLHQRTLSGCGSHEVVSTLPRHALDRRGNVLRLDAGWSQPGTTMPAGRGEAETIRVTDLGIVRIKPPAAHD